MAWSCHGNADNANYSMQNTQCTVQQPKVTAQLEHLMECQDQTGVHCSRGQKGAMNERSNSVYSRTICDDGSVVYQ